MSATEWWTLCVLHCTPRHTEVQCIVDHLVECVAAVPQVNRPVHTLRHIQPPSGLSMAFGQWQCVPGHIPWHSTLENVPLAHEPYHCHHVHRSTREPTKVALTPMPGHPVTRQSGVRGWRDDCGDEPVLRQGAGWRVANFKQ